MWAYHTFQSFKGAEPCAVKISTAGPPWNAPANIAIVPDQRLLLIITGSA